MIHQKPSIYNGPTLYNGDGSIYNGNGVYNMGGGSSGGEIVYKTNFENFNKSTGVDNPQIGVPCTYSVTTPNNISIVDITIDGVQYKALKLNNASRLYVSDLSNYIDYNNDDFTIESTMYRTDPPGSSSVSSGFASCTFAAPIAYNGYRGNRFFLRCNQYQYISRYYNNFYRYDEDFIFKDTAEFKETRKIVTAGMSKKDNMIKFYTQGLKAFEKPITNETSGIQLYNVNSGNAIYVLDLTIWKNYDKFEVMEG